MEEVTMYKANDGTIFGTKKEAIEHEAKTALWTNLSSLLQFNGMMAEEADRAADILRDNANSVLALFLDYRDRLGEEDP